MLFVLPPSVTLSRIKAKLLRLTGAREAERLPLPHPIDKVYGIETSGLLGYSQLKSDKPSDLYTTSYGGSQPSIVRQVFGAIPELDKATLFDVGCGKGRVLAVATEFPFRAIIGVELSPALAPIAEANAEVMAERFPDRRPITVIEDDALAVPLPGGPLVVYFFHPFYRLVMKKVLRKLERAIKAEPERPIFVAYYNPVDGDVFDQSPLFRRHFAANMPFAPEELGSGASYHDRSDCVVVWQSCRPGMAPAHPDVEGRLRLVHSGCRAELAR